MMKFHSKNMPMALMCVALLLSTDAVRASETDIAKAPLASASVDVVKPNVMFVLDDSGSMDFAYMPDDVSDFSGNYGFVSSQCNGVYYDPTTTYTPPIKADGKTSYPNASFTAAWRDGYHTSSGTVDLSDDFEAINGRNYDNFRDHSGFSAQAAFYYTYTGTEKEDNKKTYNKTSSTFYKECNSNIDHSPGNGVFTKVIISAASSAALKTNFANWYSYYRTRMQMMKTAAGLAFNDIDDAYRVGYSTINYSGTSSSDDRFLQIADFDTTQKAKFYTKLYGASTNGGTPLRGALAKAGRIYAGQLLTGTNDPVQYSCQQNFTILSTDGYWNGGESGAVQINGSTKVGNQDATELRPMYDGTVTTNNTYTTATLTFSGSDKTSVTSITVHGQKITSGPTRSSSRRNTVASRVADVISHHGYTASVDHNVVTIKAPTSAGPITDTPVVNKSGGMSVTATAFNSIINTVTSGGVSNSLADVAAYYYNNDLRTSALGNCVGALGSGTDVCANNVIGSGLDNKGSQHMTTFTLGLGANGTLAYSENYLSGDSADYEKIKSGPDNWPTPQADKPTAIDDLWHAAVNGRGNYFSAQTPSALVRGISKALAGALVKKGSGAAAATSNLEPVAADNFLFLATYRTGLWDGDLQAKTIDPSTGAVSDTTSWSAQEKLDAMVSATSDTRTIYTYSSTATNKLKTFAWANLSGSEKAYFNNICSPTAKLSQCVDTTSGPNLTTAQKDLLSGPLLLSYIRGETGNEDQAGNADPLYRDREHVLGDMIGSQPVYVQKPPFTYVDGGYDAYKTLKANRTAMVYVAANDGMLHAFDATIGQTNSGKEQWAYIPPMVMLNLYKLADKNYGANHQYYVDGAPTVADICPLAPASSCTADQWKSILIGGLNAGGKGYYALDITDPANPKAMWNFTDDQDIGFSYGNPIVTKRQDGTWVAVFTSGYNNHTGGGDGKGHLYIVNANTGALLSKLDTTAGDTSTPSGLAKINAWIDSTSDNTAKRFYGGDLLGNVWRFDPDDRIGATGNLVTLLAQLGNVGTVGVQPVTIKPELTQITDAGTSYPAINIATGRYLGISDLSDTSIQSVYVFKDNLSETGLGKLRTPGLLVQQTISTSADGSTRSTSSNPVNWASKSGWFLDLNPGGLSPGERVNVDMQQQLGLLTLAGNVPESNACTPGGYAWIYSLNFKSGQVVPGADFAGRRNAGLVAGLKTLKLTTGKTITLVTDTSGNITGFDDPTSSASGGGGARRVSWRELIAK